MLFLGAATAASMRKPVAGSMTKPTVAVGDNWHWIHDSTIAQSSCFTAAQAAMTAANFTDSVKTYPANYCSVVDASNYDVQEMVTITCCDDLVMIFLAGIRENGNMPYPAVKTICSSLRTAIGFSPECT